MSTNPSSPKPEQRCPHCAYQFDSHSEAHGQKTRPPRPKDFTLCINCGTLLRYQDDLTTAIATPAKIAELSPQAYHEITTAQAYIRKRGKIR